MNVRKRFSVIIIAVFAVSVAGGLSFAFNAFERRNDYQSPPEKPVPLPTMIDPNFLAQVNDCFMPIATFYGYTLRINEDFRTFEEQDEIYNQGRTVNGHIVTDAPAGKSIHNYGLAVDVVDRWRGYDIDWDKLGRIGAYCRLEHDDEVDFPHFEQRGGLTTTDFAAGKRPPFLKLPCALMRERAITGQPLTREDLDVCGAPDFNLPKKDE
ncbi:hypothetical protein A3C91_00850 [Candidatus Azambacteria bacterium RIFCSPHIGHO2_02_FULL_52_12]|uniref:D-alanyl-D-alanine carboxypeptidase-like core domain-containing protein n=1 Tax=Candidatus Azambacteria bacterium RIFCSPLOWO2_01_FULL_46_25 TaxID=1797298 RepID=A0A1F5BTX6_9BACT|nr:MAG: hypothetical protein A3C91_00850 [Candidatus Azambacteria bacterium RIFCSPHIGHO2_02_FULL_52_12]OGD34071.1 MAG: hypothetical protein A2988_01130 [Candidatus Azambacteria bacterium RIFCSPLOWO2_01_FULL_46_25]